MKLPEFFGIDIGNHSIKMAQIQHQGPGKAKLVRIGHLESRQGVLNMDDDASKQQLITKILQLKEASGITVKKVAVAIPESAIFTRLVLLPDVGDKDLEESVYYEAQQYLPTPVSEVQIDHIPIDKVIVNGRNLVRSLLVAAPKNLVQKYVDLMQAAQLEPIAIETEAIASARAITFSGTYDSSVLVLDFGAYGTDMSVIKQKSLIFTQSLGTGSDALTRAVATDFGLDQNQAEQYKRTYGLLTDQAEGKIARSLEPVMQVIINEVNKTLNYFRAHLQESTPKQILVVGDGSKLPGLATYLFQQLGIETKMVDAVSQLEVDSGIKAEVAQLSTVGFTVALGLALKQE